MGTTRPLQEQELQPQETTGRVRQSGTMTSQRGDGASSSWPIGPADNLLWASFESDVFTDEFRPIVGLGAEPIACRHWATWVTCGYVLPRPGNPDAGMGVCKRRRRRRKARLRIVDRTRPEAIVWRRKHPNELN